MEEGRTSCGKKRSSISREADGSALPMSKRMQSVLVITGPDGQVKTRDGHREPWSALSKFDSARAKKQLVNKTRMPSNSPSQPTVHEQGFWTPEPPMKTGLFPTPYCTSNHTFTRMGLSNISLGSDCASTPKAQSNLAPPLTSARKLKSKAIAKLQVLDDQELQASRLVKARQDLLMERHERAYVTWLNYVLDKPATSGSRLSNFEDFVSRNSTSSPISECRLIEDLHEDKKCLTPSLINPMFLGRSPRNALTPLNGLGNRGFGSSAVGNVRNYKRPIKDVFTTADRTFVGQSPATPHLSSKRLKMITEHGFPYPRDAHMHDVCRLSDLARRLKLHFNQTEREEILVTITQLAKHIDEGRLRMKKGCAILADVALRKKALNVLLNYNGYWMRIGLHVVLGHTALLKERLNEDDSKWSADKGAQDAEFALLEVFLERHFLAHPGLAKNFATNKAIEGLYRDGYSEALGRVILKRFFLLVLVLDKTKCQTSLKISDGIDGVDGGSPPLFRSDARLKSSRQALQEFLSDVMHGEGDVIGNLSALGYQVHHHQVPLADYNFAVANLIEDLQDGVRLCRLVQLLAANDTYFLEHIQVPSNGMKRKVHNCEIALESLAQAGVPLEDEDGCSINAADIVCKNRDKVFPLLWNIMVHLQIPLLVSRPRLCQEIAKLQGTEGGVALGLNIGTVELLLKWTQVTCMISGNLNVKNFKTSFADGQALCLIVNLYLPLLLPQTALLRPTSVSNFEERLAVQSMGSPDVYGACTSYKNVVAHNFGLVQDVARKLGNIPEVLDLVDLLDDPGISERNIIIFVAFLCSRLLKDKPLDLVTIQQQRQSIARDIDVNHDQVDQLQRYSSQCSLEFESPSGFSRSYSVPWPQHEALCGTLQSAVVFGQTRMNDAARAILIKDALEKICIIQAWWRALGPRKQFLIRRSAAQKIQKEWRRYFARIKHDSAATIQAHWRGYLLRQMLESWTSAASVIQYQYRGHVQRTRRREQAAHILQFYFRAWVHKRRYLAVVSKMCKIQAYRWAQEARGNFLKERRAVRKIEIEWLHYVARTRFLTAQAHWQESRSAQILQAHWRGYSARQMLIRQSTAASLIQSWFRAHLQRKGYQNRRLALLSIQAHVRAWIRNRNIQATKIQACWRGHQARRQFELQRQAAKVQATSASLIQRWFRGDSQRKKYQSQRLAVQVIQIHVRSWIQNRNAKVTRIQACWRCHQSRRQFAVQKQAVKVRATSASLIQRCFRGNIQRKGYQSQRLAVQVIQVHVRSWIQTRNAKATRIQACWRGHEARRQLELQKQAAKVRATSASLIQRCFRGYIQRKEYQSQRLTVQVIQVHVRSWIQNRNAKATRIQACWRRYQAQRQFELQTQAAKLQATSASLIQRYFRGNFRRKEYQSRRLAVQVIQVHVRLWIRNRNAKATRIQSGWRRHQARRQFELQKQTAKLQATSASIIQRCFRGNIQRKKYQNQRLAVHVIQVHVRYWIQNRIFNAARIQAIWRGYRSRQHFEVWKKAAKIQSAAASRIQSFFRVHVQRRDYRRRTLAVQRIQAHVRSWIGNRSVRVTRIQAWWRSYRVRQQFKLQKQAVKKIQWEWRRFTIARRDRYLSAIETIQARWRGYLVRESISILKFSVNTIQRFYRGHLERKKYQTQKVAVIVIQAQFRALLQMRSHQAAVKNACKIQARWRARAYWRRFLIQKTAARKIQREWRLFLYRRWNLNAMRIQAGWRGYRIRKVLSERNEAASVIQCVYRGHLQKADFRICRKATVTIQAHYRGFIQRERFRTTKLSVCKVQEIWRARKVVKQRQGAQKIQCAWRLYRIRRRQDAATRIQAAWLSHCCQRVYLRWRSAAILLQSWYRGRIQRRDYVKCKDAARSIQVYIKGWIQMKEFRATLAKMCRLQAMWRAHSARAHYLTAKIAVGKILRAWRHYAARRRHKAVLHIQANWKGYLVRQMVRNWKAAIILIQKQYRSYVNRREFRRYKDAVVRCQAVCRGLLVRKRIEGHKEASTLIQAAVRGFLERHKFTERRAANRIQSVFRAWHAKKASMQSEETSTFLQASLVIQAGWKQTVQLKAEVDRSEAASKIQALYRRRIQRQHHKALLNKASEARASDEVHCISGYGSIFSSACHSKQKANDMELQISEGLTCSEATIHDSFRGSSARRFTLTSNCAAVTIQRYFRRYWARKLCRQLAKDLLFKEAAETTASEKGNYLCYDTEVSDHDKGDTWHAKALAASMIQTCWRDHRVWEYTRLEKENPATFLVGNTSVAYSLDQISVAIQNSSQQELRAGRLIFSWLRTWKQHLYYLKLKRCVVLIQRHVRGWINRTAFAHKKKFVTLVQRHWRGFLVRRGQSQSKSGLGELRQRIQSTAAAAVQDSERLCNRLTEALALLLGQKTVTGILNICRTIDIATQRSITCCERLAEAGAIPKLLHLIQTMNRSPPHEEVLKHCLSVLNTLGQYSPLATLISEAPAAISTISEQLVMFRNNDEIFAQAISVLQLVCKTPEGVQVLQRDRTVFRRFQLISQSLDRKIQVEKRNVEKLPPSKTAAFTKQRKSAASRRTREANFRFLSLFKDMNRMSECPMPTAASMRPTKLQAGNPTQKIQRNDLRLVAPDSVCAKRANPSSQQPPRKRLLCRAPDDVSFQDTFNLL